MKRSRLTRKTPFKNGSTPLRRGALQRGAAISRAAAKPKPPKRDPAEAKARAVVAARSGGLCERCGRAPATNWHHRQGRSAGGVWSPENGLHLCGSGTTGCHGEVTVNPRISYERGWSVRSTADPAAEPVWLAGRGWHYLDADGGVRPTDRRSAA
jgi:hypothetical protein